MAKSVEEIRSEIIRRISVGETIRSVQKIGPTALISLPPEWLKKYNIDKGSKLLLRYNGVVVITPKIEDVRVEVREDSLWFFEGERRLGISRKNVKRLVDSYGMLKAVELIKTGMQKRGFHPVIFFDKIDEAVTKLMVEFL